MSDLKTRALELSARGQEIKSAGMAAQMMRGPQLIEDTAQFLVDLAAAVDALTPFVDEAGGE